MHGRLLTWLSAGAYAAAAALRQALRDPRWLPAATVQASRLVREGGWRALRRYVVEDFLARHFRERTRVRLGGPSPAFRRKFGALLPPAPAPAETITLPEGSLREPVRILLIRSGAMGDVLMTTPIVRQLALERRGHARIDVATHHPEVFRRSPHVHRVITPESLAAAPTAYDVVIDLDGAYERNPACHAVDAYAVHALGHSGFDRALELFPGEGDRLRIDAVLAELGGPYLVVHKPEHHWPNRNLPRGLWESLLHGLLEAGVPRIVQIGGAADLALGGDPRLLDHRGRYGLHELQLLIDRSAGFVGVDAGPLHVAASTQAPICAFFTSAHHRYRQPLRAGGVFVPIVPDIDCYGCQASNPPPGTGYHCRRGDNACVRSFDATRAVQLVRTVIR